jgi:hypothetical protein
LRLVPDFDTPLCDGATHTDVVAVNPTISSYTSTGVPFKTGSAIASAFVTDCSTDPNTFVQTCDNASTGPVTVKISDGSSYAEAMTSRPRVPQRSTGSSLGVGN